MSADRAESLRFYNYLRNKIGTEKIVKARRLAFIINDAGAQSDFPQIGSGSRGEGLDLKGSDIDLMYIDSYFIVHESEKDVVKGRKVPLVMDTLDTQPCFTRLRVFNEKAIPKSLKRIVEGNGLQKFLSNDIYKRHQLNLLSANSPPLINIHGPCLSDDKEDFDFAFCLKCDKWISHAQPWINRSRTTWPSSELTSKILACGVLFVPIGYKGSINEDIEWRISFSVAEKMLIFSFNHTHLLVYSLLKIFLKDIVDKNGDFKGLLCSYFLKTLMFWMLEESEPSTWRPDNIIPCFMNCLYRLIYCIEYSTLLHYFIPENNLLYLRFNFNNRIKLIEFLQNAFKAGIACFSSSEYLCSYFTPSFETKEFTEQTRLVQDLIHFMACGLGIYYCENTYILLKSLLHYSRTSLSKDIFILIMSLAHQIRPQTKYFPYKPNNKRLYFKYRCDLGHLLVGVNSDAVSGWLMIATLFQTYKRHGIALRILNYVLSKCNDEHIYIPPKRSLVIFNETHQSMLDSMKQEKIITILKAVTSSDLHFYLRSSIIPTELQLDVIKYVTPFPHLSYAYFLKFLCFFHLNDLPKCKDSINQIRLAIYRTVNSDNGVFLHLLKSLVCYGVAYQMIGELDFSRHVFQMVANIDREHKTSALLRLSHLSAL
ncbi:uncharacterized protein LOC127735875 [Mytilus californianus]|uniref:uncharacterized protein LOC127735875 n=1 Tax=Mytilus californianus TaxID=6549 RepID=UPI0022470348|nr:uncharacterized protein LOC127735875 [Mytilus californianus]